MSDTRSRWSAPLPGLLLAAAVTVAAWALQGVEERLFGHAIVEAIVLAILLGMLLRTAWKPGPRWEPGIKLAAKQVLEIAIVLLGASVNLPLLLSAGAPLVISILLVVVGGLAASYGLGRALGLNPRLATLIACGNAICGNSAIAAVAPVIGADKEDVASSIAFTAVLGVIVVLGLPLLIPVLAFSDYQYGALAGMTVYAVPQVIAATFPVSALSGEVGTLVKLVRVLLLGPIVVFFSLRNRKIGERKLSAGSLIPWFITGFLVLAMLRSIGLIPAEVAGPVREVSRWMTVIAMAALGLGVDVRVLGKVGGRVIATVTGSLIVLITLSAALIRFFGIG
ncbi:putative sulfate exporter family transporter [Longimicrobium terrae]|uniref:Putative integral membrane protein (TIGR00698 family) n=1 Tax=Longimicrobium terrae TaxID=1639882 RepID=A0A841H436_9BACT|nr:putative integral membrane protein (TIGR00698 family) [Longimicrobium terrae]MBB6072985.1 putative integral membrane protein (TIGR00698 family) [Longimicrobium terrae]